MQILIPAAGMGKRLDSETENKTKAMVVVAGKTLIERCLDAAVAHPITRIILIVGYQKTHLMNFLGDSYRGVEVVYVENNDYATTNNIYSVYLARDYLAEDDTILIESDLIFDPKILDMVIKNKLENLAVVDKYKAWMDGTVVKMNNDFSISHFIPKSSFNFEEVNEYYKTVNIYKFSKSFLNDLYLPFLTAYAAALGDNEYYEQVLKVIVNLDTRQLHALPLDNDNWYEIDDIQDLDNANLLFAEPEEQYDLLSKRYGGYWRYDELKDFCYLVNPFFPPKALNDEIKFSLPKLMQSYPSSQNVQALLGAKLFGVSQSCIVVGNGAAELIDQVTESLKGKFGIYGPTFEEYTARFQRTDLQVSDQEGFTYGKRDILSLAESNDGVILINPDNPSGNFIPYQDIIEILETMRSEEKYLVIDESFLDFAENGFESSVLNQNDLNKFPNLIVIKSIGKSYGVGGLRLGVLASSNVDLINSIKTSVPIWNINSVAEFYMQIIGKYKSEYRESCDQLISARRVLYKGLSGIDYLEPYESQANYIFCKVVGKKSHQIASELCSKYSILIKDCSGKNSINGQFIRVAVRDTYDNEYLVKSLKSL
jgi:histidinol-phosphate/aromatic aminotransferase/cobyric acid decarboxylase-like protein/choline kinase